MKFKASGYGLLVLWHVAPLIYHHSELEAVFSFVDVKRADLMFWISDNRSVLIIAKVLSHVSQGFHA